MSAALLHAENYGLKGEADEALFRKVLSSMDVPQFVPKDNVKIQVNENEAASKTTTTCRCR